MLNALVIPRIGEAPVTVKGNTVIISDKFNNPLVVVTRVADDTHMITTLKDPRFEQVLAAIGIRQVAVDDRIIMPPPEKGAELLMSPHQQLTTGG